MFVMQRLENDQCKRKLDTQKLKLLVGNIITLMNHIKVTLGLIQLFLDVHKAESADHIRGIICAYTPSLHQVN